MFPMDGSIYGARSFGTASPFFAIFHPVNLVVSRVYRMQPRNFVFPEGKPIEYFKGMPIRLPPDNGERYVQSKRAHTSARKLYCYQPTTYTPGQCNRPTASQRRPSRADASRAGDTAPQHGAKRAAIRPKLCMTRNEARPCWLAATGSPPQHGLLRYCTRRASAARRCEPTATWRLAARRKARGEVRAKR